MRIRGVVKKKKGVNMTRKEKTVEERIKTEKSRLTRIFKDLEKEKRQVVEGLIDNASFMRVQMEEMSKRINEEGVTIKYQNGANQWGYKKSPDVETYSTFSQRYNTIIKQLTDLLPKTEPTEADDGFFDLINS